MFTARLIQNNPHYEQVVECSEYLLREHSEKQGLEITFSRPGGGELIVWAQNSDEIYIENANGKTVDLIRLSGPEEETGDTILWRKGHGTIRIKHPRGDNGPDRTSSAEAA